MFTSICSWRIKHISHRPSATSDGTEGLDADPAPGAFRAVASVIGLAGPLAIPTLTIAGRPWGAAICICDSPGTYRGPSHTMAYVTQPTSAARFSSGQAVSRGSATSIRTITAHSTRGLRSWKSQMSNRKNRNRNGKWSTHGEKGHCGKSHRLCS